MSLRGYIGDTGEGKTGDAVQDLWAETGGGKKRPVYSNIELVDMRVRWYAGRWDGVRRRWGMWDAADPKTFGLPWSTLVRDWGQIRRLDHALVFLDEIQNLFGSHEWGKMPPDFLRYVTQHRHYRVDLWWTSPMNSLVDNKIRDLTAWVWHCMRLGEDPGGDKWRRYYQTEVQGTRRRPTTIFNMQRIDMRARNRTVRRMRRFGYEAFDLYNTHEIVGDKDGGGYGAGPVGSDEWLRPEQRQVLIRYFGPDHPKVGLCRREVDPTMYGWRSPFSAKYTRVGMLPGVA